MKKHANFFDSLGLQTAAPRRHTFLLEDTSLTTIEHIEAIRLTILVPPSKTKTMAPILFSTIMKRDDEYAIPKMAIVILCMLGSGFLIAMMYAASRLFMVDSTDGIKPISMEQHEYLATVRARNLDTLQSEAHMSMYGHRRPKDAME